MNINILSFQSHGDDRGQLVALEQFKEIPFNIKRVYYMFDTKKDVTRGKHAHKQLQQVLVCIHGSCKIRLDNGYDNCEILLDSPTKGIFIENSVWRELYGFSPDAVLMVLASELYDESDYIRDYNEYIASVRCNEIRIGKR